MPISYRVLEDANVLVTELSDPVDPRSLLEHLERVKQEPRLAPGYRSLFDVSRVFDCNLTTEAIRAAARIAARADERLGAVRVAVLAPHDLAFGLGRMYAALTESLQREVRVFRTASEAHGWLDLDPAELDAA